MLKQTGVRLRSNALRWLLCAPLLLSLPAQAFEHQIGVRGGKRVVANRGLPNTFNAYLSFETASSDVIGKMYVGLVATDPITTDVHPVLAASWHISPDRRTYTFKLREGLKWSDGQPLTAEDVVFTYREIINNPDIPNNARDSLLVEDSFPDVNQKDRLTVVITTAKPFAPFLRTLHHPIMPKHILQGTTRPKAGEVPFNAMWDRNADLSKIVVNGPWRPKSYTPGREVVLERNPHFFRTDKAGNALPYLDEFVIKASDRNRSNWELFEAGEIDAVSLQSEDYAELMQRKPEDVQVKNLGSDTGTLFVMFNMSTATDEAGQQVVDPIKSRWFRNVKFRQALAHAINKERMIAEIYRGQATPQYSHVSQQNPFYNANVSRYPYDLKQAARLLTEAGFRRREGRLFDDQGHLVEFNLVTNQGNRLRDQACQILSEDWQALGITVNYIQIPFNHMVHQLDQTLDWEAMMVGLTGSAVDAHNGINCWRLDGRMHMFNMGHPSRWTYGKPTRFEPWEQEVQDLYEQAAQEFDPVRRKALYFKAQEVVAAHVPMLYTVNPYSLVAYREYLGNIAPSIHGGFGLNQINWNSEYHYIIKE
ncbi:MAG: ABC transporter substrate-binding protein [Candidatus Sericytochromatia bacterium]|nr:ABC transporter substrate-binding protein [Candidatus Sericytochromatia bacterium]